MKISNGVKPLIIANWKCNPKTLIEAKELFNGEKKTSAIICPPFQYLAIFKYKNLGAQNCFWKDSGPYTGEVSPKMLKSVGCKYIIIGHSERRAMGETNAIIKKKLKAALDAGLIPIFCIRGKKDLKGIENWKLKIENLIFAYEPVWAIGTGNFCKPQKAKQALDFIKQRINNKVLYGGSVNSKIARDYIKVGFDGLLVGGASLDAREFTKIVKNV